MDINRLFRAGERQCGRVLKVLPKEEIGSPREYMMEVLQDETLPVIDVVFPLLIKKTFSLSSLIPVSGTMDDPGMLDQSIDDRYAAYRIPPELVDGNELMIIKDFVPTSQEIRGGTNDGYVISSTVLGFRNVTGPNKYGRYSSANMYESVAMAQLEYADKQLMGGIQSQFRYYFYPPNIVYLSRQYTSYGSQFTATFGVKNDPNLITIPDTAYPAIKRLFILDLKATIFGEYGLFSEVETPGGTVTLNISDWATADGERIDLANEYRSKAHFRNASMRTG